MNQQATKGAAAPPAKLLTVPELAQQLRVSKTTVYRLVDTRKIPFFRLPGGLRFTQADIDKLLESFRVAPIDPTIWQ